MANLIITIISIALVAVAALMGAYYGGQAFNEGQTKAIANTLVSQAEMISAAMTIGAMNESGGDISQYFSDNWGGDIDTFFSNLIADGGLSSAPVPPTQLTTSGWYIGGGDQTVASGGALVFIDSFKLCQQISIMAKGSSGTPELLTDFSYSPTTQSFDCACSDDNTNAVCDASDSYAFYYKIKGFSG
ncbi:MAG TPA: hypothetical protein PKW15_04245 [Alphaproteobacteria bacterium]|nr:hypothetical protein [Rhodospirillaceae bacterium]HRJ12439.1 hypothetical protein [Alphaproteobacteria bacterium]